MLPFVKFLQNSASSSEVITINILARIILKRTLGFFTDVLKIYCFFF